MTHSRMASSIVALSTLLTITVSRAAAQAAPPPATTQGAAGTGALPGTPVGAQPPATPPAPAGPTLGPPVRRIESASAVSTEPLGSITNLRHLSDGRVLLNDGSRRRLLLLDSTLSKVTVILDSLTEVQNAYGTRAGALLPYRADTTFFLDPGTFAMLVIDADGKITRVRSVPRAQDAQFMASVNGTFGYPAFDAAGRLVYRINAQSARPLAPQRAGMPYIPQQADSAFIVGIHLDTRKLDTLGAVRTPRVVFSVMRSEYGFETRSVSSPLPLVDDWAVLSDGTVAFIRGRDYRIDYLAGDGAKSSSEKLPFPWTRLTDDDKTRFVDSMKVAQTRNAQTDFVMQMIAWSNLLNKPYPAVFIAPADFVLPMGLPNDWILPKGVKFPANYAYACPLPIPGAPAAPPVTPGAAVTPGGPPPCRPNNYAGYFGNGYTPPPPTYRPPTLIPVTEMPDYKPPITQNSVRADADGNLWIRVVQLRPVPGGTIYDIVNRAGVLFDRIQIPPGYQIAGFGAGKIVYLSIRDATGLHLARVRLR